jgi:hypothetical protein
LSFFTTVFWIIIIVCSIVIIIFYVIIIVCSIVIIIFYVIRVIIWRIVSTLTPYAIIVSIKSMWV